MREIKLKIIFLHYLDRGMKSKKDPKKILNELQQQEEKLQKMAEIDSSKAKELKEKVAWKNILQKAEGEKVKDDPTLLKKSIKKMVSLMSIRVLIYPCSYSGYSR